MDASDSSSSDSDFAGFSVSDIQRETARESDEEESESDISVSSVNTADLSDWDDHDGISSEETEEEVVGPAGDARDWSTQTQRIKIKDFREDTGVDVTVDGVTQLQFFYKLFEEKKFEEIAVQTNEYARKKIQAKEREETWIDTTPTTCARRPAFLHTWAASKL